MNNQWKLVPAEATREILVAMLKADGHVNRYRDAIAAAPASPQASKPFMYGIMQPDGAPHYSELCVSGEASDLESEVESMNDGEDVGYRVVELYTLPDAGEVERLRAERDALQLRLNTADQRIDEMDTALNRIYTRCEAFADDDRDMRVASVEVVRDIAAKAISTGARPATVFSFPVVVDPTLAPNEVRLVLPVDPERERLAEIIERYPNGDPLEYNAALRKIQQ